MADNAQSTKQQTDSRNAASNTGEAVRAGAQAAQQSGQAGAEAIRRTAYITAKAFADSQREIVQQAAGRFEEVSHKVAEATQRNSEDLRALMSLPNAAQGGLQDLQQSVAGLVEGVVRTNLRATQELFQLANPAVYVELQQRFAREFLDKWMQGTATLVRATRRTADETLRPLEQQIEQRRRQQQGNQGQGFQHAAE